MIYNLIGNIKQYYGTILFQLCCEDDEIITVEKHLDTAKANCVAVGREKPLYYLGAFNCILYLCFSFLDTLTSLKRFINDKK
uniref:Uncharacterized protein n=1 Tax=Phragmatopoma lapidosa TaxID=341668 RepID=D9ILV3_9ANNE|nr:hypothetical protein [Phragmatopoma lapidosa]